VGRIASIQISAGGVPKLPVEAAEVGLEGLTGDGHFDTRHHGGPERAVCLFSLERIDALREEGHPIGAGTTGENVTLEGVSWDAVAPGARLKFAGGVELEVVSYTTPCATIRDSFRDGRIQRIRQKDHPGWSRVYARVVRAGRLAVGEAVEVVSP
jgi:MOSC domain-containing protein YiiM